MMKMNLRVKNTDFSISRPEENIGKYWSFGIPFAYFRHFIIKKSFFLDSHSMRARRPHAPRDFAILLTGYYSRLLLRLFRLEKEGILQNVNEMAFFDT